MGERDGFAAALAVAREVAGRVVGELLVVGGGRGAGCARVRVAQLHPAVVAVVFKGRAVALGVGQCDRQAVGAVGGGGGAIRRTTVRSFPQTVVRPLFLELQQPLQSLLQLTPHLLLAIQEIASTRTIRCEHEHGVLHQVVIRKRFVKSDLNCIRASNGNIFAVDELSKKLGEGGIAGG